MTMFSLCLHTVDPSLGRLDYDSLSDQALMEMLVAHIEQDDIDDIKDANGNFKDACEWEDVFCEDGRVTNIDFSRRPFVKSTQFPFEFIPSCVDAFAMHQCFLYGTFDTSLLPQGMSEGLFLSRNDLYGSLDFQGFPRKLIYIILALNKFCGRCALEELPPKLIELSAEYNKFSGELRFDCLPPTLRRIGVRGNHLSGSITICNLPQAIEHLNLSNNSFSGEFQLQEFPPRLRSVDIAETKMSATAW